jgi:hypothetical protein
MIHNVEQLFVTMQQMERLIRAVEDLKENVLPKNPQLFATLAEAPLEDLGRLREEINGYAEALKPTG